MAIIDKLMKIAGKDDFQLDERISTVYILRLCWRYGWMMVRGRFFSFGCSNIANDVFIGHGVKTYEKKYLIMGRKTKLHDGVYIDALSARLGGVFLGDHVVLERNTRMEFIGVLGSLDIGVRIGNRSTFVGDCFFGAAGGIEIGEDFET